MPTTSGSIIASINFDTVNELIAGINVPVAVAIPQFNARTALANGTTAGTINVGWADTRTLTATSVTLDLTALAAASTNTGAAAFSTIVGILIKNNSAVDSANSITVGNAASLQAPFNGVGGTNTVVIKPGGSYLFHDPSTLGQVCSTNKNLKIDAGAGTASFTIAIVGRS